MTDYTPVVRDNPDQLALPQQQQGQQDLPANQYRQHYQAPHHHHHHDKSYMNRIKDATYGTWLCFIVTILVVGLFIFAIVYIPVQTSNNNQEISQLKSKLDGKNARFTSNGIHSTSSGGGGGDDGDGREILSFCHLDRYHVSGKGALEDVVNPVLIHSEPSLPDLSDRKEGTSRGGGGVTQKKKKEVSTYYIEAFLQTQYNVESEEIGRARERHGKKKYESYFIVHYELDSNFPEFSTIRLVESILDTSGAVVRINRDIILCSNNPLYRLDGRRCSQLTNRENHILLNHTLDYPMILANTPPTPPHPPHKTLRKDSQKEEDQEEEEEGEKKEEEKRDLRFYQLHFYREVDDGEESLQFQEYVVISIEPNRCSSL